MSFTVSDNLQSATPQGQYSTVYTIDVNGTQVIITNKSANANDRMYLKQENIKKKNFFIKKKRDVLFLLLLLYDTSIFI